MISANAVLLPDQSLFHPSGEVLTEGKATEGKPFQMVIREALENCGTYEEVKEFMESKKRTLDAFVGVADTTGDDKSFKTLIYRFLKEDYTLWV